ncbi:unnamed protein product, partial [Trichogramma brassicae]
VTYLTVSLNNSAAVLVCYGYCCCCCRCRMQTRSIRETHRDMSSLNVHTIRLKYENYTFRLASVCLSNRTCLHTAAAAAAVAVADQYRSRIVQRHCQISNL